MVVNDHDANALVHRIPLRVWRIVPDDSHVSPTAGSAANREQTTDRFHSFAHDAQSQVACRNGGWLEAMAIVGHRQFHTHGSSDHVNTRMLRVCMFDDIAQRFLGAR